jgi:putative tricarboxylic transport membrane protein
VKRTKVTTAGATAIFWVVVGVLACYGAIQLGLGNITDPGAGFIFFWSGLILVVLSLVVLADSIRSTEPTIIEIGALNWTKIALILVSLSLYGFLLERLGFALTTFFLLSFLLGRIQAVTWGRSLATSVAATLACYGIFELWLKIRLPKGILGF